MSWSSIAHLVEDAARRFGDEPLFVFAEQTLSFAQADRQASRIANALQARGVRQGDRAGVMLPNGLDFPLIWFALAKLGAVIVPVNSHYHDRDLAYALSDAQASFFIVHADYLAQWGRVRDQLAGVQEPIVIGDGEPGAAWQQQVATAAETFDAPRVQADDLINIQYTSGTTGFPKGCMLSHRYWLGIGQVAADYFALTPDEVNLTAQPFYYMDPQWNTIACLIGGARLVILPKFSPAHFWAEVCRHRVTVLYLIGAMPRFLFNLPPDPAVERSHRLRVILCSGIPPKLHAAFELRWGTPWREAFGMTETGVDLIVPLADTAAVGTGAMGKPIASKTARIVNPQGNDVPDGAVGELVVRGEPMMLGYWQQPEATAAVLQDGWLHTGDLVSRDERGYFHWQGRLKDTVRRAGENISTAEVEHVLMDHPAVREAAVVPVSDPLRGEEVKAYIVLQAGYTRDNTPPEDILEHARVQLAYFKTPRYIEYVDNLPRTPSERVAKHVLLCAKPDLRAGSYDARAKSWWENP